MYRGTDYRLVEKMREIFPAEYQGQVFFDWVPKKETYEITYYFVYNGQSLRCDAEINQDVFSTPYYYNWTDKDVDAFVQNLAFTVNGGLEEFE